MDTPTAVTETCPLCLGTGEKTPDELAARPYLSRTCIRCHGEKTVTGVEVLVTDQWTSTGNLEDFSFDQLADPISRARIRGGDSETAAVMFGGAISRRLVNPDGQPSCGNVWFRRGADGHAELWKTNYDSSD